MARPRIQGFVLTREFYKLRVLKNMTQQDIARRAKTDRATISRLEAGKVQMRVQRARRLARSVGMTLEQALDAEVIAWPGSNGQGGAK